VCSLSAGISRDSTHKRRASGGKRISIRKKRKFELGRAPAMTKLVSGIKKRVRTVRARGGNRKFRALRLDFGSFSWGSEGTSLVERRMICSLSRSLACLHQLT